jgi:hypothetical protein
VDAIASASYFARTGSTGALLSVRLITSATRGALAMIVKVGFTTPMVRKKLVSTI